MPRRLLVTVVLVGLAATACGGSSLRGRISEWPRRGGEEETPIARARVLVQCAVVPAPKIEALTDAKGLFYVESARDIPNACTIEVSKAGYRDRTYRVLEACALGYDDRCKLVMLTGRLQLVGEEKR
jgi:hypothetical protein